MTKKAEIIEDIEGKIANLKSFVNTKTRTIETETKAINIANLEIAEYEAILLEFGVEAKSTRGRG